VADFFIFCNKLQYSNSACARFQIARKPATPKAPAYETAEDALQPFGLKARLPWFMQEPPEYHLCTGGFFALSLSPRCTPRPYRLA